MSAANETPLSTTELASLLAPLVQDWGLFHDQQSGQPGDGLSDGERQTLKTLDVSTSSILVFALSPVQEFIESSKSLRDLWASSLILSQLVDGVLSALRDSGGFVVYPRRVEGGIDKEGMGQIASIPHRFLSVVPSQAPDGDWKAFCQNALERLWEDYAGKVHKRISDEHRKLSKQFDGWDKRWKEQVNSFWEVRAVSVPLSPDVIADDHAARMLGGSFFSDRFPELAMLRSAAAKCGLHDCEAVGRWQLLTQLAIRLLTASYPVRYQARQNELSMPKLTDKTPDKCRMFGSMEVIGPDPYGEQIAFWSLLEKRRSLNIKEGERYCAVGMIKRLLPHCLGWQMPRFDDSARMAAGAWLRKKLDDGQTVEAKLDECVRDRQGRPAWDSRWLHEKNEFGESEESYKRFRSCFGKIVDKVGAGPPVYYAVLLMDADHCHRRLAGKSLSTIRTDLTESLTPTVNQFDWWSRSWEHLLSCRRPLTPAYHLDISRRQSEFGVQIVPEAVSRHCGQIIYDGGDEFLALLPVSNVFTAAKEIRDAFSQDQFFGTDGTLSAGIALAHYKTDLRAVLQETRTMIAMAKSRGRDLCQVSLQTRSGETTASVCPWSFMPHFAKLVSMFSAQENVRPASDRWLRAMLENWPTLRVFDMTEIDAVHPAILSVLEKQVAHADRATCKRIAEEFSDLPHLQWKRSNDASFADQAATIVSALCGFYVRDTIPRFREETFSPSLIAMEHFLALCRIASFCSGRGAS